MDGVLLLDVDEHVDEEDDEVLIDDDDGADVEGIVEWVALTTIVFGAFPFITFTFTTLTTVVLLTGADDVVIIDFEAIDEVGISVHFVNEDDVVGIAGTFLSNLGEVCGL